MAKRILGGVTSVRVGRGVLSAVADGAEPMIGVLVQPGARHVATRVIADLEDRGIPVAMRVLPDSEAAKSLTVVEETVDWLRQVGLRRNGVLLGIGGGALTDTAGFIASVYMRGVEARYVPTTLLGAVDAAIGGKTALNVAGKNLVGTFAHPERVIIDVEVLEGLVDDLLAEGMAEALKAGFVGDPGLVDLLESEGLRADLADVVERAIAVKAAIVDADFREAGVRAHLNFGHTVGHAIETLTAWSHGNSVAVGMVAAAAISQSVCGFDGADRLVSAVASLGLPTECSGPNRSDVHRMVQSDKKSDCGGTRMVLLEAIGRPLVSPVDAATLDHGLDAIGIGER